MGGNHRSTQFAMHRYCTYSNGNQEKSGNWDCNLTSHSTTTVPAPTDDQDVADTYAHKVGQNGASQTIPGFWDDEDPPSSQTILYMRTTECFTHDSGCTNDSISFSGLTTTFIHHHGTAGSDLPDDQWQLSEPMTCPFETTTQYTPIVFDLSGQNFPPGSFTDVEDGILFDFVGDGHRVQMSWTAKNRDIGFLWLDRADNYDPCGVWVAGTEPSKKGCNGKVDSARELFGNLTRQLPNPLLPYSVHEDGEGRKIRNYEANGFEALRIFDVNHDGQIDEADLDEKGTKIFDKLRVWVDICHCGDSTAGKQYTLRELGIKAIPLSYSRTERVDQYGNRFRFMGHLVTEDPTTKPIAVYDVFFVSGPPT
jgi:hypothetical protein